MFNRVIPFKKPQFLLQVFAPTYVEDMHWLTCIDFRSA